jgi:hypothetical protein
MQIIDAFMVYALLTAAAQVRAMQLCEQPLPRVTWSYAVCLVLMAKFSASAT